MFKQMMFCLILVGVVCSPVLSFSAGKEALSPVAQKAKHIVEAAHAYVREHSDDMAAVQKALMNDPGFRDDDKDLYIFMYCYNIEKQETICCGHGAREEFLGKNMWKIRTPNGRQLFYETAETIEANSEAWTEYEWLHPVREKVQTKNSYIMKIVLKGGQRAFIGCGFWK